MTKESEINFDINSLFNRAKNGDKNAENVLLKHLGESFRLITQHRLWNSANSEDIAQEAMIIVISKYKSLEVETSFTAWAYKILNNKIMDYIKKKTTRGRIDRERNSSIDTEITVSVDPDFKKRLIDCFKKLNRTNSRHARILNLHYQGYTTEEICDKLRTSKNNIYVLLNRARTTLENCLEKRELKK